MARRKRRKIQKLPIFYIKKGELWVKTPKGFIVRAVVM